jgi:methylenetetrahydrofolate dehydrogenase (NADP+)/methenyltetrahydrofolate cyclohydrolase
MATIVDGKKLASKVKDQTKLFLSTHTKYLNSYISILQVGDDEATNIYIRNKTKVAEELGLKVKHIKLTDTSTLKETILKENTDNEVIGILLQSPLPNRENLSNYTKYIDPKKDIDCLTPTNLGNIWSGDIRLLPATVKAVMVVLEEISNNNLKKYLKGKNIVIVNHTVILGKPLAGVLLNYGATVTVCHSETKDLSSHTRNADILITGVGIENLITKDMIKKDSVLIDCGITRNAEGKVVGDMSQDLGEVASVITPVPGGIGPLTVACVLDNIRLTLDDN